MLASIFSALRKRRLLSGRPRPSSPAAGRGYAPAGRYWYLQRFTARVSSKHCIRGDIMGFADILFWWRWRTDPGTLPPAMSLSRLNPSPTQAGLIGPQSLLTNLLPMHEHVGEYSDSPAYRSSIATGATRRWHHHGGEVQKPAKPVSDRAGAALQSYNLQPVHGRRRKRLRKKRVLQQTHDYYGNGKADYRLDCC